MCLLTEKLKVSVLKIDKTKPQQEIVYLTTLWWKIEKSGSCLTNAQGLEKKHIGPYLHGTGAQVCSK